MTYRCPQCLALQNKWSGECEECSWIDTEPEIINDDDREFLIAEEMIHDARRFIE